MTFHDRPITGVIHCAGLKAVGEAEMRPLTYYGVNVGGAFALTEVMGEAGVATLVYSSSATVYGQPDPLPVNEDAPLAPQSVYGRTKRVVEDFLRDLARANPNWRIAVLRYFNPAGAHPSGLIGESPTGRPNNLVPLLCRIAAGEFSDLAIYGTDWPTPDGTGVRDYLHVQDLAAGHVAALATISRPTRVPSRSIWASDAGVPFSMSSLRSKARAAGGSLDRSRRAGPATSPPVTRIRRTPRNCWAGARPAGSTRSARMRGGGSRTAGSTSGCVTPKSGGQNRGPPGLPRACCVGCSAELPLEHNALRLLSGDDYVSLLGYAVVARHYRVLAVGELR